MGMTMTQKILAAHAGLPEVKAGQLIEAVSPTSPPASAFGSLKTALQALASLLWRL